VSCGYRPPGCLPSLVTVAEPAPVSLVSCCGTAPLPREDKALPVSLSSSAPSLPPLREQPALVLLDRWKADFSASPHTQKCHPSYFLQTSLPEAQNKTKKLQVTLHAPEVFFFFMCFTGASNYMDKVHLTSALHKKQQT